MLCPSFEGLNDTGNLPCPRRLSIQLPICYDTFAMPFCPNCRDEFEDWVETCPDCKVSLVDEQPPKPKTPFPPPALKQNLGKFKNCNWLYHAIVLVLTAIILASLLATQPWSSFSEDTGWKNIKIKSGQMDVFTRDIDGKEQQIIELSWIYPDRYSDKFLPDDNCIEFIVIGNEYYSKEVHPDMLIYDGSFHLGIGQTGYIYENGTAYILDSLIEIKELPDQTIHGVDCFHYEARIDMNYRVDLMVEELEAAQLEYPEAFTDTVMEERLYGLELLRTTTQTVEYWISIDDGLFRQLIINSQELGMANKDLITEWGNGIIIMENSIRITYYNINHPITINPPETPFGGLLPGWQYYEMNW